MVAVVTVHRHPEDSAWSTGYTLELLNDSGEVVLEYHAGGHRLDSGLPGESAVTTCMRWGRISAEESFEEEFGRYPRHDEVEVKVE